MKRYEYPVDEFANTALTPYAHLSRLDLLRSPSQMKLEMMKMASEKRNKKQKRFKKKRKEMAKKRINEIYAKDWNLRMEKLKSETLQKQNHVKRQHEFLKFVAIGHFQNLLKKKLCEGWFAKDLEKKRQTSAEIITRQIRLYSYRCYRSKVRGAIKVLGAFFIMRIKIWKKRRDHRCADLIIDFLGKLKAENDRTGGIFKVRSKSTRVLKIRLVLTPYLVQLVAKGERLKRYKRDIILIQNNWRRKWRNICSQIRFIDRQWSKYQDYEIDEEVSRQYELAVLDLQEENDEIDMKNKGRKLMKKKLLPCVFPPSKLVFREKLLKTDDVLEDKYTCPREFRLKIIKWYLKWAKREVRVCEERSDELRRRVYGSLHSIQISVSNVANVSSFATRFARRSTGRTSTSGRRNTRGGRS